MMPTLLPDLQRGLVLCIDGVDQRRGSGMVLHGGVSSCSQKHGCHLGAGSLHADVHQGRASSPVLGIWICLSEYTKYRRWKNFPWCPSDAIYKVFITELNCAKLCIWTYKPFFFFFFYINGTALQSVSWVGLCFTLHRSWIADFSVLKTCSSVLPSSMRKHFQSILNLHWIINQSVPS